MRAGRREAPEGPRDAKVYRNSNRRSWRTLHETKGSVSATIRKFVSDATQARRYFVSGIVQGVGFRFYAQRAAEKLHLSGYVRNCATAAWKCTRSARLSSSPGCARAGTRAPLFQRHAG